MRDAQYPLRRAIDQVLTGNVLINGQPINFYDEKKKAGNNEALYCIYGTQQSTPEQAMDSAWITRENIDIEIIQKTQFEVSKDLVDEISNQLYTLLMPQKISSALTNPHLMQVQYFDLQQAITRSLQVSDTESIVQKIVTFTCLVVQQKP